MKIVITADIVPTTLSEQAFIDGKDEFLFSDVKNVFLSADRTIVNLECALTEADNPIRKIGPNLKASPKSVNTFKKLGVTDCALSNNHVFDFGIQGLRDTMQTLDGAGIGYTGVGENDVDSRKIYYMEHDGKKAAIVNVCEHEYSYALPDRIGANPFDPFRTMQDVRKAKESADCVIVMYHGGKELSRYPSPRLVELCRAMVDCGADVVLTQHSHCIGCYEQYNGGHILYGQGNCHFAKENADEMWNTALIVEVEIKKTVLVKFYPIEMSGIQMKLAKGARFFEIMNDFNKRNIDLASGEWRKGWHEFCVNNQSRYVNALERFGGGADERECEGFVETFAHFLDCEAHTDVWRELYPTWHLKNTNA
ncbi:MAG: CapA family protein [Clostridia bacterium]|nr:CapA family protein [Clostridia bacterium]